MEMLPGFPPNKFDRCKGVRGSRQWRKEM